MAFHYGSSYAASGYGEYNYNYNSYSVNYDYAQNPGFMAYNYQQFNQPYYDGYDSSLYYDPAPTYPAMSYSATTFSEPKFLEYDPNYEKTQLVIYCSNLEFNETEFEEYDPTPYGGGYDIVETYGKPLAPSDQTCYPRSGPVVLPLPLPLPAVEKGTDEKAIVPQNQSAGQVTEKMPQPQLSLPDLPETKEDKIRETQDLVPSGAEDVKEEEEEEDYSRSGYGNGYNGGQHEEYERAVPPQYPSGYGLEALDICESLFGYWACLAKMKKRENCCCERVREEIEGDYYCYRETTDYLFGSPYPYGGGRGEEGSSYGGSGEFVFAYQRQYPTQAQYGQVQNYDNSSSSSWWW